LPTRSRFAYRSDRPLATTSATELQACVGPPVEDVAAPAAAAALPAQWREQAVSVLVVLQAVNAGGKDGLIEALGEGPMRSTIRVERLKRPVAPLARHDLLRQASELVPRQGELVFFNRSYYEDLVHAALHGEADFSARVERTLRFEQGLTASGIAVVKLHLHIDKEEQLARLEARRHPHLRHLLNPWDHHDQTIWQELMEAYDAVLTATHTTANPWLVIPANDRSFRNLAVLHILDAILGRAPDTP
jgi:polyphosphate kinase 2 (PPK2 family)